MCSSDLKTRSSVGEKNEYPSIKDYLWAANGISTTYGPTASHIKYLDNATRLFNELEAKFNRIKESLIPIQDGLDKIEAPAVRN